jgi:hypothetical protein
MERFTTNALALSILLTGCSINAPTLQDFQPTTPQDDNSAVAATPLSGNIKGTAFTAKVALARNSFGSREITIYDQDASCSNVPKLADGRSIFFNPESWSNGAAYALSWSRSATLFVPPGTNIVAVAGRVEVVTIGTDKTAGAIRVRATAGDDTKVEGEVPVYTCDK